MSALEEKLDALIAKQDHVRSQDVTLEYIRRKRDEMPTEKYDFSTNYGGYNRRGKKVLTEPEALESISTAYKFLDSFSKRHKAKV